MERTLEALITWGSDKGYSGADLDGSNAMHTLHAPILNRTGEENKRHQKNQSLAAHQTMKTNNTQRGQKTRHIARKRVKRG